MKFSELELKPEVMAGLVEMGYTDLTPIQEETFPHILSGKDILAQAETGSGKTSACAVPMVQKIDMSIRAVQGLIIVPTRELAVQYVSEIAGVARHTQVAPFAVYGGFSMSIQRTKLDHGVHILVATPGRLIDLLYNTPLQLKEVRTFVLDEADEMLKMGFIDDVEFIFSCLVHEHQTLLFSATMPPEIKRLTQRYLKDPVTIALNLTKLAPSQLQHHFQQIDPRHRYETLRDYLRAKRPTQTIVFCNSRLKGDKLADALRRDFDEVEIIHGGLEQSRRTSLFHRFRQNKVSILVATDIASRGLDFSHVSHVINYDFPHTPEAYTHRTGRTARMGREGTALTFVTAQDAFSLKSLLRENRLEPMWQGEPLDLTRPSRPSGGGYRRGGGGKGRPRRSGSGPSRR